MPGKRKIIFGVLSVLVFLAVFILPDFIFAAENLEEICQLEKIEQNCAVLSPSECRVLLEKCESYFQDKSAEIEKDIDRTQTEKETLENQIYILKNKIKKLDYQIYQNNLMIKDLSFQIGDTEDSIEKTSLKIEDSKNQLSKILREIYEQDQRSTVEILIGEGELSDFFDNLVALESLNSKNQELLKSIKSLKSSLETQKQSLDDEKVDLERVISLQTLQRQESASTKLNKDWLLEKTAGKESEYQKLLTESKKKATEIRTRIFELIGVPDAPTFGEAVEIAKFVSGVTGIRPAFLLAILTQESNIGKNVGQCYLTNFETGQGVRAKTGKIELRTMKPTRDVSPFLTICRDLGRDPKNTPVSCPMEYGWGGAMGPAQFIPSTWIGYHKRIKEITGKPGDPWSIKDAFLAAALYLTDSGAAKKTSDAEWKASLIYFSGSVNTKYRFYADSVLNIAEKYEEDIKAIENGI